MALVTATGLKLQYLGKTLFDGANLQIEAHDRLGIVGRNGTGKSTLLKLLSGQVEPESGDIVRARGLRIGYLPQELSSRDQTSLIDSVLKAAPKKDELESRAEELARELETAEDGDRRTRLTERLSEIHEELIDVQRAHAPHIAEHILEGLGFTGQDFVRPLTEFSGGWRMRAELARLLFEGPELLLLDEPTNHLDLPSVNWLNRFLDDARHALVLICHDRAFLNRHVERIAALEPEGLRVFRGDFDRYREQRAIELETMLARQKNQEARTRDLEAFVTRFKAKASKARQAQSKQKLIEKIQSEQVDLPKVQRSIRLRFPEPPRSGDPVIEIEGLAHAYSERPVFAGVDATVRRGDRVAIVGRNGAGKTTLLKIVANEIAATKGTVRFGHNVKKSYFAQHHAEQLTPNRSILDEVRVVRPDLSDSEVRGICGAFLFSGDEVTKRVSVLSGGEKARVALARLLVDPGNLLLLDEPTNHLDTESSECLLESLADFPGTILFVSHNLDFAKRLATRVWDLKDGRLVPYPGTLSDYLDRLSAAQSGLFDSPAKASAKAAAAAATAPKAPANAPKPDQQPESKEDRIRAREQQAAEKKDRAKREKRVAELEADVQKIEAERAAVEKELADPDVYADSARSGKLVDRFNALDAQLARAMAKWEAAANELSAQ